MPTRTTRKQPAGAEKSEPVPREAVNVAVVRGAVSSPPERRVLPSDAVLVPLQVPTRLEAEALSMPVVCWDPDAWVEELEAGAEIVGVGRVRRRFFRAGGATASRVELEAEVVAKAADKRRVRAALRRATAALEPLDA